MAECKDYTVRLFRTASKSDGSQLAGEPVGTLFPESIRFCDGLTSGDETIDLTIDCKNPANDLIVTDLRPWRWGLAVERCGELAGMYFLTAGSFGGDTARLAGVGVRSYAARRLLPNRSYPAVDQCWLLKGLVSELANNNYRNGGLCLSSPDVPDHVERLRSLDISASDAVSIGSVFDQMASYVHGTELCFIPTLVDGRYCWRTVMGKPEVGELLPFMIAKGLNASDVAIELDGSAYANESIIAARDDRVLYSSNDNIDCEPVLHVAASRTGVDVDSAKSYGEFLVSERSRGAVPIAVKVTGVLCTEWLPFISWRCGDSVRWLYEGCGSELDGVARVSAWCVSADGDGETAELTLVSDSILEV